MSDKINISVSLIDYIGEFDGGVGVILSLNLNDELYEMLYWFNPQNKRLFLIEDKFYQHFPEIRDIQEYEYFIDLLYHIDTEILPDKQEIFNEFL